MRRILTAATIAAMAATVFVTGPAQATAPDITGISSSQPTIYPLIANATRPGFSTITVTGNDTSTVDHLEVRNTTSTNVRTLNLNGGSTVNWDGRNGTGSVVPAGAYTVVAIGSGLDVSSHTATITVSTKKLITKTFSKTVTPAASLLRGATSIGKCSSLKKPAKKKWKGSFGYYANTKCKTQTANASLVLTQHVLRVPGAEKYLGMRVNTYGGAHKKGSHGVLIYMEANRSPRTTASVGGKLGSHTGPLRSDMSQAIQGGEVSWVFGAGFKSQYDVKSFTVVISYQVLG